jgi:hypothetical protein
MVMLLTAKGMKGNFIYYRRIIRIYSGSSFSDYLAILEYTASIE